MNLRRAVLSVITALFLCFGPAIAPLVSAQATPTRPKAVDLLPDRTVVYVQVDDIKRMFEDFGETGFGKMLQDESIAPFVTEIWGEAKNAYADVQEQVGVEFEDLESLPQGEICFAVVAPRRSDPAFVLLMDVNRESGAAESLLERARELAEAEGGTPETEEIQGVQVHVMAEPGDDFEVRYVLHEGTFLAATNQELMEDMLTRWLGAPEEDDRTLKDNRKFVTIMNKCQSTEELPMSLAFFVDPIELVRSATRGNVGATAMLGALPILGLDGFLGVGGASLFNEQGYESIFHLHVLLANPRAGIFEMIAMKPGKYEPEPWVPDDVVTYMTSNWDFDKFVAELEKIVDTFGGEGNFNNGIQENINDELGIDFRADLLDNLDGRLTYMAWIEPPARFNSQINAGAVQVSNPEAVEKLIGQLLERANEDEENIVSDTYRGVDYWKSAESFGGPDIEVDEEGGQQSVNIELRPVQPCFVILEDYFIVTESPKFLERIIDTHKGDEKALVDDELFRNTTNEMTKLLGTQMPSVTMYSRPDLTFRMWFEMAQSDNTRELLARGAEDNKYVKGLQRVIEENPLPDFDAVKHYFAPSGAFITNDETGFHMLAFQIKIED